MKFKILVLTFVLLLGSSSCIEKPVPTQIPTLPTPKPPDTTIPTITEKPIPKVIETPVPTPTATISIEALRLKNIASYYINVELNRELQQYLKLGKFTSNSTKIQNISDELWNTNVVFYGYHNVYNETKGYYELKERYLYVRSENPILDYVNKTVIWAAYFFAAPSRTGEIARMYDPKPADVTLTPIDGGKYIAYCDDVDIVVKSLLLQKGIPSQIRVLEAGDMPPHRAAKHSAMYVWLPLNNSDFGWYKIDPTVEYGFGMWLVPFRFKEPVTDITDLAPYDSGYKINAGEW